MERAVAGGTKLQAPLQAALRPRCNLSVHTAGSVPKGWDEAVCPAKSRPCSQLPGLTGGPEQILEPQCTFLKSKKQKNDNTYFLQVGGRKT